jgi:porin
MKKVILFTALGVLLAPIANLHAGDTSETSVTSEKGIVVDSAVPDVDTLWTRDKLTGDWGGLRTDLTDRGIDLEFRLSQYYQGVASGGVNQDWEYGGTMDYRLNIDAEKLFGAKGWSFNMHARTRYGQDINSAAGALALPNAGMMMPAPGDYHGTDITGLNATYMFSLTDTHLLSITAGQLDVIDLVTGFFPNIGYGQEGFQNVNSQVSAMPWFGSVQGLSLYGGMAITINEKYGIPQTGVIAAGTENSSTSWPSVSDSLNNVYWAAFHRFIWEVDEKMGYFMVYGGASTKDQASNDPLDFVAVPGQGIESTEQHKPWDIALYLYQDIWQDKSVPKRKANVMIGGTVGPDNPQFAQTNIFANIEAFGLIPSRPHDRVGFGGWWNGLSSNVKELVSPVTELGNTWGLEMYYNYEITPWAHLSADLQLLQNQNKGDDFAILPGVRMVIEF